jgi:predicted nucleotidyltransferase
VSVTARPTEDASRQRAVVQGLVDRLVERPWFRAAILVGSLASDMADELSDVDLLVVVNEFTRAWREREELGSRAAIVAWDARPVQERVGVHKWLTRDLVLVECLLGEAGAFRLAEPYRLLAGDEQILGGVPRRPRLTRAQVREGPTVDPIERTYDDFKSAVRARQRP